MVILVSSLEVPLIELLEITLFNHRIEFFVELVIVWNFFRFFPLWIITGRGNTLALLLTSVFFCLDDSWVHYKDANGLHWNTLIQSV